jgi:hypothetical protein
MFEYFYNEILRSTIIAFGSLFNSISIKHKESDGDVYSEIQVPLAYGPTQKFLARMRQEADLNRPVQITLPRMSFEFIGLEYDTTRKSTQMTTIVNQTPDGENIKKNYMPVPYNMKFQLAIYTKLNDDMLQIVEQILPYFQPYYNLSVNYLGELKERRDVAVQLDGITMEDNYEGNFDTRRALYYTLNFTVKTYLFGPITDVTDTIVKKVSVGYRAGDKKESERDVTYTVVPRATKDYDGVVVTNTAINIDLADTLIPVVSSSGIAAETYIYIGEEEMYVEKISGNNLTVRRGQDNTIPQKHVNGAPVYNITNADDALIEFGDDFGFDGSYS